MNRNVTAAEYSFPRLGVLLAMVCLLAAGCAAIRPAPVIERTPQAKPAAPAPKAVAKPAPRPPDVSAEFYTIRPGDTLYSIALDHGLDYRELAAWNNLDPARIRIGQQLRLTPPPGAAVAVPLKTAPGVVEARPLGSAPPPLASADNVKTLPKGVRVPYSDRTYAQMASLSPEPAPAAKPESITGQPDSARDEDDLDWSWPASGKVVSNFDSTSKGIAIAGKLGQPVLASAGGRVIFSGIGIRGFGKLIVIKHNKTFLSVYAHNSELLVKEGQTVTKGQKIAVMGNTDADQVKLYFEIRRLGKPIDPVKLLPERAG